MLRFRYRPQTVQTIGERRVAGAYRGNRDWVVVMTILVNIDDILFHFSIALLLNVFIFDVKRLVTKIAGHEHMYHNIMVSAVYTYNYPCHLYRYHLGCYQVACFSAAFAIIISRRWTMYYKNFRPENHSDVVLMIMVC